MIREVEQFSKATKLRLDKQQKIAEIAQTNFNYLESVLEKIESGDILYKEALTRVIKTNRSNFYTILRDEAIKAAQRSEEYDYPAYLSRLAQSINLAQIRVRRSGKKVDVAISLDPLGNITEWAAAVKTVRRNTKNAKTRAARHKETGENLAYRFWKEKIYGAGREGKSVSRRRWNRRTRSYSEIDVTAEFRGKYEATISQQLALVKGAPFWYLIEHGNANPPGFKVVAPAYPKVNAQNFVEKTRLKIKSFIQEELQRVLLIIESEWIENLAKSLGLRVTPKLKTLLKEYRQNLVITTGNAESVKKLDLHSVVAKISTAEKEYNIIITSKSLGLRYNLEGR